MHSSIVEISPALAKEWLESNTFNRKMSTATVSKYAGDMSAGVWRLNHQGIAFDDQGVLVDGQHRLAAIVKSGCKIRMMVTWGADRVGIDELRVRSVADVIKFGGISDWIGKPQVEVAKQMLALCCESRAQKAFSTNDLVSFAEKNKDAIQFACKLFASHEKGISCAAARAVVATAYYYFSHDDIAEFVSTLYSGIPTSPERSAAIKCRDIMIAGGFSGGSSQRRAAAYKMMRAITAFCKRQQLKSLKEQSSAAFLVPEDRV